MSDTFDERELHFDAQGRRVPDPRRVLGLSDDASLEQIEAAYRDLVRQHPPETDPEAFRRLTAARRRLTHPQDALLRSHGSVRLLDPEAFGLPPSEARTQEARGPALEDELFLYALVHTLPF